MAANQIDSAADVAVQKSVGVVEASQWRIAVGVRLAVVSGDWVVADSLFAQAVIAAETPAVAAEVFERRKPDLLQFAEVAAGYAAEHVVRSAAEELAEEELAVAVAAPEQSELLASAVSPAAKELAKGHQVARSNPAMLLSVASLSALVLVLTLRMTLSGVMAVLVPSLSRHHRQTHSEQALAVVLAWEVSPSLLAELVSHLWA
jgi:hypothetical protein